MSFICNQRRCCKEAFQRRKVGAGSGQYVVEFLKRSERYRRPSVDVGDYFEYGAGSQGVFLSCTKDGTIRGAAMLALAAMDKLKYFLSGMTFAIAAFSQGVSDFTLQDGVGIAACVTLMCNTEMMVNALLSGELAQRWHERKHHVGGVCGLLLSIAVERNGGLNKGAYTRRCQPFCCVDVLDCTKLIALLTTAVPYCRKSHSGSDSTDISKLYDTVCLLFQRQVNPSAKDINLSIQTFVHLLAMCGFLRPLELCMHARVSATNSNAKRSPNTKKVSFSIRRDKLTMHQQQLQLYLGQVLQSEISMATVENIICECTRVQKTCDIVYPGQVFLELEKGEDGRLRLLQKVPSWNNTKGRFDAGCLGVFEGVKVDDWNAEYPLVAGEIPLKLDAEGSQRQILLNKSNVGALALRQIKEIFCQPIEADETPFTYQRRINEMIAAVPGVQDVLNGKKRAQQDTEGLFDWEEKALAWSREPDLRLEAASLVVDETEASSLLSEDPLVQFDDPTQPKKSQRKSRWDSPAQTVPNPPSIRTVFRSVSDALTRMRTSGNSQTPKAPNGEVEFLGVVQHQPSPPPKSSPPPPSTGFDWDEDPRTKLPGSPKEADDKRNKELPTFIDADGYTRRVDWSDENLEKLAQLVYVGDTRIGLFPTEQSYRLVAGSSFAGFSGSRDLLGLQYLPKQCLPTMMDEARNAYNANQQKLGRLPLDSCLKKTDFIYRIYARERTQYFSALCARLEGMDFSRAGKCLLCDKVALLLQGQKLPQGASFVWGFENQDYARQHLLFCTILTSLSGYYLTQLHARARKRHLAAHRGACQVGTSSGKPQWEDSNRFVVAFTNQEGSEIPYFYVIGSLGTDRNSKGIIPSVFNDFCIAVPDLGFYRKHYCPGTRKPSKRDAKGDALYFRPIQTEESLFELPQQMPLGDEGNDFAFFDI